MTIQGVTATFSRDEKRAQDPTRHKPVVVAAKIKADDGTYPTGMLVKVGVDGETWEQTATGGAHTGVIDSQIDTTADTNGLVVIHGSVNADVLCIGNAGGALAAADLRILQTAGIFP